MNQENVGQDMAPQPGPGLPSIGGALDKLKTPVFWFAIGFVAAMVVTRKKKTQIVKV